MNRPKQRKKHTQETGRGKGRQMCLCGLKSTMLKIVFEFFTVSDQIWCVRWGFAGCGSLKSRGGVRALPRLWRPRCGGGREEGGRGSWERLETLAFDRIAAPSWRADGFIYFGRWRGTGEGHGARDRGCRRIGWFVAIIAWSLLQIYICFCVFRSIFFCACAAKAFGSGTSALLVVARSRAVDPLLLIFLWLGGWMGGCLLLGHLAVQIGANKTREIGRFFSRWIWIFYFFKICNWLWKK